jgi:hypothetical protein
MPFERHIFSRGLRWRWNGRMLVVEVVMAVMSRFEGGGGGRGREDL